MKERKDKGRKKLKKFQNNIKEEKEEQKSTNRKTVYIYIFNNILIYTIYTHTVK